MAPNSDLELIEKYLNNELPLAEREGFDRRLADDQHLNETFRRHQSTHAALDYLVAKNLRQELQTFEEQERTTFLSRRRRLRWTALSAAASIVLAAGFFLLLLPGKQLSNPELAAEYYRLPDAGTRNADASLPAQETLNRGIEALQQGEYADAITSLATVPVNDPYYLPAQYFLGHALYLTGRFDEAEQKFSTVAAGNDLRYAEAAEWYALLSCLARDGNCQNLLAKLTGNPGHPYHNQARQLGNRSK